MTHQLMWKQHWTEAVSSSMNDLRIKLAKIYSSPFPFVCIGCVTAVVNY